MQEPAYSVNAIADIWNPCFSITFIIVSSYVNSYDNFFSAVVQMARRTRTTWNKEALETYVGGILTRGS
jgi:hypothetical protein